MEICRSITTPTTSESAFTYLADFTTTTEWDPGTVSTMRLDGDGGVGTTYRNVSRFLGRETELIYEVEQYTPGSVIVLRGENSSVIARDTITVERVPSGGSQVTYRAEFAFKGLARLVAPLLGPALRRLGDNAEIGLRNAVDALHG